MYSLKKMAICSCSPWGNSLLGWLWVGKLPLAPDVTWTSVILKIWVGLLSVVALVEKFKMAARKWWFSRIFSFFEYFHAWSNYVARKIANSGLSLYFLVFLFALSALIPWEISKMAARNNDFWEISLFFWPKCTNSPLVEIAIIIYELSDYFMFPV